jgi:anaerobic magnesium-protoporphyrin IX monomethyl ester cyclase
MNVAFVTLTAREPLAYGIMSLAGSLRQAGHQVSLVSGQDSRAVATDPRVRDADVIALSATTGLHRVYVAWAHELRARFPDKAIVMGGPHATFHPDVLSAAPLDGICIGEGEESFPEMIEAYRSGFSRVPAGWWIRKDGGKGPIEKGPDRPPPRPLDALPPPAFDLFYDGPGGWGQIPNKAFLATRGCPHRCTYCFNRTLNERYRPYGPLIRTTDPDRMIDQILAVENRWGTRLVWFLDANFTAHRPWFESFAAKYARRVGLPYFCKLRPETASDRVVRALVDSNCTAVGVGIESGSERLRRDVLGRPRAAADILAGCRRLKARGIRILSFSMLGIPSETFDEALETVALNVACGVDFAAATILQPYPGTEIARYAVANGHFDGDFDRLGYSYFAQSPLRFPSERDRDKVTNLQRLFSFAVEFPEVRSRIRWLVDRSPNRLFTALFEVRHVRAIRHTFYEAFTRFEPMDTGTEEHLRRALQDLSVAPRATANC